MHTIPALKNALGLATANQVRNRIEAIRDLLEPHMRRGPNNQILVTDEGLAWLRRLQALHDSGLTMEEASEVIRENAIEHGTAARSVSPTTALNQVPTPERDALIRALREEIDYLRRLVADLQTQLSSADRPSPSAWWESLRGEIDAT